MLKKIVASLYLLTDYGQKYKVKVRAKLTLEQATKAQRGSRGTDLLFF
jgi:hypothetical protein